MWALADRQEVGSRSATHVQLLMRGNTPMLSLLHDVAYIHADLLLSVGEHSVTMQMQVSQMLGKPHINVLNPHPNIRPGVQSKGCIRENAKAIAMHVAGRICCGGVLLTT
uniref:Uncharacterized protein n=1 Tax=Chlamydomonas euryale TaxID=1486919 RepID=A0A7R9VCJ6_9CHLO